MLESSAHYMGKMIWCDIKSILDYKINAVVKLNCCKFTRFTCFVFMPSQFMSEYSNR